MQQWRASICTWICGGAEGSENDIVWATRCVNAVADPGVNTGADPGVNTGADSGVNPGADLA